MRRASTSTVAIFANSEGWNLSGPRSSQRLAPNALEPITSTSTRNTSDTPYTG